MKVILALPVLFGIALATWGLFSFYKDFMIFFYVLYKVALEFNWDSDESEY